LSRQRIVSQNTFLALPKEGVAKKSRREQRCKIASIRSVSLPRGAQQESDERQPLKARVASGEEVLVTQSLDAERPAVRSIDRLDRWWNHGANVKR
jgi:hypothetical protein